MSQEPFTGPYLRSASSAYWEQVGVNRQLAGLSGEIQSWYSRTSPISGRLRIFLQLCRYLFEDFFDCMFDCLIVVDGLA